MGWFILILVLIALAFGILGAVVKAVVFVVLTVVFTLLALGALVYFGLKHQLRRSLRDIDRGRQLPS
jgi:hypothetical protein